MHDLRAPRRRPPAEAEAQRQTQAERRESAERAILEAATQIVAERGLEELTLNEAGERAGYSRALPAHYFGSKATLVSALADHIVDRYAIRVRESMSSADGLDSLLQRIAAYVDERSHDPVGLRAFQAILGAGVTNADMGNIVARLNRESVDGIAALIKLAREKGEIRADARPRAEASIIVAAMRGVMFQWLIDPNHVSLSRVRDVLIANLRKTLAP
jgi:AcrR family transcriptional regulator